MEKQSYPKLLFDSEALTAEQMNGLATPGSGTANDPATSVLFATAGNLSGSVPGSGTLTFSGGLSGTSPVSISGNLSVVS